MPNALHWEAIKSCTQATLGDAVIMLIAFWTVSAFAGNRYWIAATPRTSHLALFVSGRVDHCGDRVAGTAEPVACRLALLGAHADTAEHRRRAVSLAAMDRASSAERLVRAQADAGKRRRGGLTH